VSNTPKTIDTVLGNSLTKMGYTLQAVASGSPEAATYAAARVACPLVTVDKADRLTIKSPEPSVIWLIGKVSGSS
jgi:hypothetical protein